MRGLGPSSRHYYWSHPICEVLVARVGHLGQSCAKDEEEKQCNVTKKLPEGMVLVAKMKLAHPCPSLGLAPAVGKYRSPRVQGQHLHSTLPWRPWPHWLPRGGDRMEWQGSSRLQGWGRAEGTEGTRPGAVLGLRPPGTPSSRFHNIHREGASLIVYSCWFYSSPTACVWPTAEKEIVHAAAKRVHLDLRRAGLQVG